MGENTETVEVIIGETGEVRPIQMKSLVSDVRNVLLQRRRAQVQSTTWANMSEKDQQTEINEMEDLAFDLISKVAEQVAEGSFDVIRAQLDQFTIKDGGVKITAKGRADDSAVMKLNKVGKKLIKITVIDEAQFNQEQEKMVADPDQPELQIEDVDEMPEKTALDEVIERGKDAKLKTAAFDPETDKEGEEPEQTQAYTNGYDAQVAGLTLDDNPYPTETLAARLWQNGHDAANAALDEGGATDDVEDEPQLPNGDDEDE